MIDPFCKAVIAALGIRRFVETGLYLAETIAEVSAWFSELYPEFGTVTHFEHFGVRGAPNPWNAYTHYPVFRALPTETCSIHSIENHGAYVERARGLFATNPNIIFMEESSERGLEQLIASGRISNREPCFFYLDAHWGEYWPLRDELARIMPLRKWVVVIDDFQVPGQPNFGYDMYKGEPCGLNVIEDVVLDQRVSIYFPVRSNRDNRGWVILFKGYSPEELAFMASLPFLKVVR